MDATVLIADDDASIRQVLSKAFIRAGCRVHATGLLTTLARWVDEGRGDVVITDVMMPDGDGLESIRGFNRQRPELPIIVISARNTILTAIGAEEAAAFAYLPKPFDLQDILGRVGQAVQRRSGARRRPLDATSDPLPMIGRTPAMQALYLLLAKIMNVDAPVLIHGESGSGKSHVARVIHDCSDRRVLPFLSAGPNFPESAAELLALMAKARRGTLLFDEIGNMSPGAQVALAGALETSDSEPPRIIATTQWRLYERTKSGEFRRDLFFRLNGIPVDIPPLRARLDDIPLLAADILTRIDKRPDESKTLSDAAINSLLGYGWPGNVRQLEHVLQLLAATSLHDEIAANEVTAALAAQPAPPPPQATAGGIFGSGMSLALERYFESYGSGLPPPGLYSRVIREVDRSLIPASLDALGGNQARCAEMLGINRNTLRKKIADLDLSVTRRRRLP